MKSADHRDDDVDFEGFEASLKSLRPRALPERFADDIAFESSLAALAPKALPEDFADLVALESMLSGLRPATPTADFADRVAAASVLVDVTPKALPEGFEARVATEIALGELRPRALADGYVDRVVAACLAEDKTRGTVIPFRRFLVPLSAAAAIALAAIPVLRRPAPDMPAAAVVATTSPASVAADFPDDTDGVSLPVVNLPDGRAYRPVIRNRYAQPVDFRAGPFGVMPVSAPASGTGVDYEPVMFE